MCCHQESHHTIFEIKYIWTWISKNRIQKPYRKAREWFADDAYTITS